jgi:predicted ATP-grasp superfamily ATP-dependent carboligase
MGEPRRGALPTALRTVGTLALLQAVLPLNLAVTAVAALKAVLVPAPQEIAQRPRTILVSGGKMTKALLLARAFHRAGHRVVLVESSPYRLTGHRFSRAVARFRVVPRPDSPHYVDALLQVVREEGVDVYVPVCSPVASYHDALAKRALAAYCEVLHPDPELVARLDDKHRFAELAASLGLPVPDAHRISEPGQVAAFDFAAHGPPYVLKSIPYDPVNRLDLTPLPRATPLETARFAAAKPISADVPWILQAYVTGQEYCAHATVRDGRVQLYCCCPSSPFQVNYASVDKPEIEAWVRRFVESLRLTGQVSFDFIEDAGGRPYAIECNPRAHSAITLFHGHPDLARAYLERGVPTVRPAPSARPTYWLYHELWRVLSRPGDAAARIRVLRRGRDAIFDWSDPLPFLMVHHLQIPWLLLRNLVRGKDWVRIDFNIGKIVQAGGD